METWAGSPLLNYILQIPCKQAGEEIERGKDKSKNGSKWISENLLRNINSVMETCGVMKSKDLQMKSVSNLNIYKNLGCPPEHLYKEPNGTMTWIITKQRGRQSGKNRISYDVSWGSTSYSNIFFNPNQFTWIYKPQFALELCHPFTQTLYSWAETGRPLLFSAGVLITLWLANEFEFKALKGNPGFKKKSIGIHTLQGKLYNQDKNVI